MSDLVVEMTVSSHEVEELKHENYQLKFKLKQMTQMSELAQMLQESHKYVFVTNPKTRRHSRGAVIDDL